MKAGIVSCLGLALVIGCTPSAGSAGSEPTAHSAAPSTSPSAATGAAELVSGTSLGPVRIGMTRAEIDALGLPVKPGLTKDQLEVGPYHVGMDGDRVGAVSAELRALPSGARVGGTVFEAASAKIEGIAKKLPGCLPIQYNEGGNVILCDSGRAMVSAGGPPGIVELAVFSPARAAQLMGHEKGAGAAPSPSCGPGAYQHKNPDFCVDLPASAKGKDATPIDGGVSFPGLTLNWVARTDTANVTQWKTPAPAADHHGTFEVLATETLPHGVYYQTHDATQHDKNDIYKIPNVRGVAVIEGGTTVVRCMVTISLERGEDPRKVAAAHAADFALCKSLRVPG